MRTAPKACEKKSMLNFLPLLDGRKFLPGV